MPNFEYDFNDNDFQLIATQEQGTFNENTDYVRVTINDGEETYTSYSCLSEVPLNINVIETNTNISSINLKTIGTSINPETSLPFNDFTIYKNDYDGSIYIKPNEILSNLGVGSGNYDITVDFLQQLGSYTQLDNTYGFESNYGTTPNDIFAPEYFSEDITTFGEQHYIKTPSKIADYYSEYGWYGTMENILPGSYCSNYDCSDGTDEAFIDRWSGATVEYQFAGESSMEYCHPALGCTGFNNGTGIILQPSTTDEDGNVTEIFNPILIPTFFEVIEGNDLFNQSLNLQGEERLSQYQFIIREISTSGKEVRLKLVNETIQNDSLIITRLKNEFNGNKPEFLENGESNPEYKYQFKHLLNIGDGNHIPITNYQFDKVTDGQDDQSIILRLYTPLSTTINTLSLVTIEKEILTTQTTQIYYFEEDDTSTIPPSGGLLVDQSTNWINPINNEESLVSQNYNDLTSSLDNVSLQNILSSSINYENLKTDYNEFENHTFFGSAKKKLENFKTKLEKIQNHYGELSASLYAQGVSNQSESIDLINTRKEIFTKIDNEINSFTPYEQFLYFDGQSETTASAPGVGRNYVNTTYPIRSKGFYHGNFKPSMLSGSFSNTSNWFNEYIEKNEEKNSLPQVYHLTHSMNVLKGTSFNSDILLSSGVYRVEKKPFFNYSGSIYFSFLAKGDPEFFIQSASQANMSGKQMFYNTSWNNPYVDPDIPEDEYTEAYDTPNDTFNHKLIMSQSLTGSRYSRYIFRTSASYYAPTPETGLDGIPNDVGSISDFGTNSNQIEVLSGSVKTGSNFITVDGPYQNLASVATQSGVPFKGAIMPSGDLFDIRFGPNVNFNNNTASGSRGLNISHSVGYWQVDAETSGSNLTEAMLLDYSYSNIDNPVTASIPSTNKPKVSDGLIHPDTGRQYGKSMLFTSGSSVLHDGHDTRGATSTRFQVTNDPNSYNFSISSSFSISIWAKRYHPETGSADSVRSTTANTVQSIFGRGSGHNAYGLEFKQQNHEVMARFRPAGSTTSINHIMTSSEAKPGNSSTSSFHHYVMTFTSGSATGLKLYVDGLKVGTATTLGFDSDGDEDDDFITSSFGGSEQLRIGGSTVVGGNGSSFNGYLQYPRVYSKELSQDEVLKLYNRPDAIVEMDITDIKVSLNDPTNVQPFSELYHTSSAEWTNWYNGMYDSASNFDRDNIHSLENNLPLYIQQSNEYNDLKDFLALQGEQYDVIRNHIDSFETIHSRGYGKYNSPPENIYPILLDNMGYQAINPFSGSLSDSLGGYINSITSIDDVKNNTFRKTLNNLIYLYKSKGTQNSVRALLNIYGYPPDVLGMQEFGGNTGPIIQSSPGYIKDTPPVSGVLFDTNLNNETGSITFTRKTEKLYNYRFQTNDKREIGTEWWMNDADINTFEFVYKHKKTTNEQTILESSGSGTASMWDLRVLPSSDGFSSSFEFRLCNLETGSGNLTANALSMSTNYSNLLEGQLWNVMLQRMSGSISGSGTNEYRLHLALQDEATIKTYNYVTMSVSGGISTDSNHRANQNWPSTGSRVYNNSPNLIIGGKFTGSLAEIKAWTTSLSHSRFRQHVFNKLSTVGNTINSHKDELVYHYKLNENYNSSSISSSTQTLPIIDSAPSIGHCPPIDTYTFNITGSVATASLLYGFDTINTIKMGLKDNSRDNKDDNLININPRRSIISNLNFDNSAVIPNNIGYDGKPNNVNSNKLEINRSPQDTIDNFILNNVDTADFEKYYGNPQSIYSSSYTELDEFRKQFFTCHPIELKTNEYIRAHENIFNKSINDSLKTIVPARSTFSDTKNNPGVIIKPTILERQKRQYERHSVETNPRLHTGSIEITKNTDFKSNFVLTSSYEQPKSGSIESSSITPLTTGSAVVLPLSASLTGSLITPTMTGSSVVLPLSASFTGSSLQPNLSGSEVVFPISGSNNFIPTHYNASFVNIHESWGTSSADTHFINFAAETGSDGNYNVGHLEPRYHFYMIGDLETYSASKDNSSKFDDIHRFGNRQLISSDVHKNITYESLIGGSIGSQTGRAIGKTRYFLTGSGGSSIIFPRNHFSMYSYPFKERMVEGTQNTDPGVLNVQHIDYSTASFYRIKVTGGETQVKVGSGTPTISPDNKITYGGIS